MFIQKISVRKGMEAYYSELPNKQADQNKRVGREDFFFIYHTTNFKYNDGQFSHLSKFIYSEMATKFCEIFTLLLTGIT